MKEFEELEEDIERFDQLFNALSNSGRRRMMRLFFEKGNQPLTFTELMKLLEMNPKIVSDSTKRLRQTGFLEKRNDGRYMPTRSGETLFLMMSVALRRVKEILEEL